jgi:transcriptional regulator with XRE-family HTH domain
MRDNLRTVRLRVGRNVRHLRLQRGLSQERLAELVGNTAKHIGQVERGEVNVTIDILTSIAVHLSVGVAELFGPTSPSAVRSDALADLELEQIEHVLKIVRRARRGARRQPVSD